MLSEEHARYHQAQLDYATLWRVVWRRNHCHQMTIFADAHLQTLWFQDVFYFNYVSAVIGKQLLYMSRYSLETVELTAGFNSVRLDIMNDVATLKT